MHQEAFTEKGKLLFPKLKSFQDFYLAGGTALALQIGHRVSVDFDLFCNREISKSLLSKVRRVFEDSIVVVSVNNKEELTVFIDGVKITFLHYLFLPLYDFKEYDGVKFLNISDIASSKAYTIGRRGSFKDYVDLYFILKDGHASLESIIKDAQLKYGDEFNGRLFLEQLIYFDDIEDSGLTFLKDGISKNELRMLFTVEIRKINL